MTPGWWCGSGGPRRRVRSVGLALRRLSVLWIAVPLPGPAVSPRVIDPAGPEPGRTAVACPWPVWSGRCHSLLDAQAGPRHEASPRAIPAGVHSVDATAAVPWLWFSSPGPGSVRSAIMLVHYPMVLHGWCGTGCSIFPTWLAAHRGLATVCTVAAI